VSTIILPAAFLPLVFAETLMERRTSGRPTMPPRGPKRPQQKRKPWNKEKRK
jgi:hypothetical protein